MKSDNLVLDKSFQFAQQIVFLYKQLIDKSDNRVLATQLLKSGTSIGANIREAVRSQSRNEFLAKMNISLKEAYESEYWLELLNRTGYIEDDQYKSVLNDCEQIRRMLISSINTVKFKK